MNCSICFEKYDKLELKPTTLMPCGHTLCKKCLIQLKKQTSQCPTCRVEVQNENPNYAILGSFFCF